MTDTERVLSLFRRSNGKLISNSSIVDGKFFGNKPILNWSARITDARDVIGCNCGIDQDSCTAKEHIRNVKKNRYQYVSVNYTPAVKSVEVSVDIDVLKIQIEALRTQYSQVKNPVEKRIIEVRGKALKTALQKQLEANNRKNIVMEALS